VAGWGLTFGLLAIAAAYLAFFALVGLAALLAKAFLGLFFLLFFLSISAGFWRRTGIR